MKKNNNRPIDRIRELCQFYIDNKVIRGQQSFEGVCGLSKRYIKNLYMTENGNPGVDTIAKIYNTFKGVNLHWLVLGEGEMFTIDKEEAISAGREACGDYDKEAKLKNLLNNKLLKGMTREEKMDLIERLLDDKQ